MSSHHQGSSSSSGRKRSRWGDRSDNNDRNSSNNQSSVSDQEAVRALLSAAAASEAKSLPPQKNPNGSERSGGGGGGRGPSRHARDRDRDESTDGHYGPSRDESRDRRYDYKHDRNDGGNGRDSKRSRNISRDSSDGRRRKDDSYYDTNESRAASASAPSKAKDEGNDDSGDADANVVKEKPNFGLSGALAKKDHGGGGSNMYKGVLLKFREPPEARAPANTYWRLYVFKGEKELETLHISQQSAYLIGRNADICDIVIQHPSASSQHAVLQYRALPNKDTGKLQCMPYIMDLESTNGCFLNGVQIDAARYYQLKKGDVLRFGASTREYVLLTANATSIK